VLLMLRSLVGRWRMKTLKPFGRGLQGDGLRVSLCDTNEDVARALTTAFADVAAVEVLNGNLLDLGCDAILSPANSFGDMGGGIDKHIDDRSGGAAQRSMSALIAEQFFGELPVGMAAVVELSIPRFPLIVAAPTMRTPGSVAGTINAYLSMRAALVTVLRHSAGGARVIRHLAIPGLCTGVGGMPHGEAASQMRAAYDNVVGGGWRNITHSALAPYALRSF
jgi:O-acetyl-ADP-ribose deacetylase (regulator of RNase III)